ncbi:MAG: alpha/beta hydrolase family protein [Anaerolineales bacterium]|jgi:dienelactone hydrolase
MTKKLSFKEKIFYSAVCNEKRVYKHWYRRYLNAGVDLDRIRRVVARIGNWYQWCSEWSIEGERLETQAEEALEHGKTYSAKAFFHEAAGCFHIGQHFFYIDPEKKMQAERSLRKNYKKAISLSDGKEKPMRVEIPFRGVLIPGYLRLTDQPNRPLIIFIEGMDNLKEIELHHYGNMFTAAGFNTFAFDGPGQGEMWEDMKFIPDYEKVVSTIIDWFEEDNPYYIDLTRIGTVGWSLGGYLSPRAAAFDERIGCAIGSGGPANARFLTDKMKVNPLLLKGIPHLVGAETYNESLELFDIDIETAPPMDRPLLIFHSGKDRLIPDGKEHADTFMKWAEGETELKYYPEGTHVCANYLDETDAYMIDWLRKHL